MVLTDSLAAYYKCDENAANTTVADAHGSNTGTSATNTSTMYDADGVFNSSFDIASGDKISIPLALGNKATGSVSMWVNWTGNAGGSDGRSHMWGSRDGGGNNERRFSVAVDRFGFLLILEV